jgi:two-component system phosphate regulon response regulator OmpR
MQNEEKPHILVVDDDDRLRALIGKYLREHGFAVSMAPDAKTARVLLGLFAFDLMVLDIMMPGETGLQLAAALGDNAPPVLMLSAQGEVDDRVAGLEVGADDYLVKPFEPRELVLRIRAVMRRAAATPAKLSSRVGFGEFTFDVEKAQLKLHAEAVYLTSAEAALLKALAENVGAPVTREALSRMLGLESGNERGVDVQVTRLRRKIEPSAGRPQFVQTVRGEGYQLQGTRL